ncbi:MAG: hypothetical protein AAGA93_04825 [Actinomycetota bacterium]
MSGDDTPGDHTLGDRPSGQPVGEPATGRPIPAAEPVAPGRRRLGFSASELAGLVDLPDDVDGMAAAIEADGRLFAGAFVPVVLHDPQAAERSYDAAEWAADLIRSAGGRLLGVATCTEPAPEESTADDTILNPRQWNHAAAMIERLEGVSTRFGLRVVVRDTIDELDIEGEADRSPIHHLLDTGRYLIDGLVPVRLISPDARS